jgi:hypothetical protein
MIGESWFCTCYAAAVASVIVSSAAKDDLVLLLLLWPSIGHLLLILVHSLQGGSAT